jgi:DNA-binding Lrp family transcriptional regulator
MATEHDNYGYTALHAFVLIRRVPEGLNIADVIEEIGGTEGAEFENGQVLFASVFVGAYIGFAHVRAADLAALQRLLYVDLSERGVRCEHAVEGPVYSRPGAPPQPMGPKRGSPPFCALVRVRVAGDPQGVMTEIGRRFQSSDPFQGASVIFGTADVLVELAGESLDAVSRPVLEVIRGTPGVLGTETSFAFTDQWRTPS